MGYNTFGAFRPSGRGDRGTRRGAKRVIVTADLQMLDHALAKQAGIKGDYFQSQAEAKRWIALNQLQRAGHIRHLQRQVRYPLYVVTPEGVKAKIGTYVADHVFEERSAVHPGETGEAWVWTEVVEDVKPSGGLREDVYLWKRRHWETQEGKTLTEWTGTRT